MSDQPPPPKTTDELAAIRLANIQGHQFKPGQSGNPSGRPKGKSVSGEIKRIIADKLENGDDVAGALAIVAITHALKGDFRYFEAVREVIDGPRARGGVSITGNMIQVVFEDLQTPEGFNPPRMPDELDEV